MRLSRRAKRKELRKNMIAVISVALFALAVFSINSVGKFIAEKIIDPVMNMGNSAKTGGISTDEITFYAVSTEICKTASDAESVKNSVTEKGGSGYIFASDSEFFPVFSCCTDEDTANAQRENIKETFPSASVTEIKVPKLEIKITGTEKQVGDVKEIFSCLTNSSKELLSLCDKYESGSLTKLQVCGKLNTVASDLKSAKEKLDSIDTANETVSALKDIYLCLETLLNESPESNDSLFLQKLRYVTSAFVCEYVAFCSELG